ncbi:MAG: PilZ domain-containing protein [Planctomycetes bacterium]|nr:PilZ domain-containing protein [Planctomycetota bacterium]
MAHILIVDPAECSCFLVKSILLGKRYGVSISTDLREARLKLETGLFDALFVDFSGSLEDEAALVRDANDILPGMPVLALYREEAAPDLAGCDIFAAIPKPVRVSAVSDSTRRALAHVLAPSRPRRKRAVSLPVEVSAGQVGLACRATDLSSNGLLIEAEPRDFAALSRFHEFFEDPGHLSITATVSLGPDSFAVPASVAFAERTPDSKVKQIGLAFGELPGEARSRFEAVLAAVA